MGGVLIGRWQAQNAIKRRINRMLSTKGDLSEVVHENGGSRKSRAGSRRESSKRGQVGDEKAVVVLKWQRKHEGLPNNKGVVLGGDGRARSA